MLLSTAKGVQICAAVHGFGQELCVLKNFAIIFANVFFVFKHFLLREAFFLAYDPSQTTNYHFALIKANFKNATQRVMRLRG